MTEEVWKTVAYDDGYQVSSFGNVRSFYRPGHSRHFDTSRPVRQVIGSHGYPVVNLRGKVFCVHVLVCEAFHGARPEKHDVAHADGTRTNNHKDNLRWATRLENIQDAQAHGTMGRGDLAKHSKMSIDEVRNIRALRNAGIGVTAVSRIVGHPKTRVANVYYNSAWRGCE